MPVVLFALFLSLLTLAFWPKPEPAMAQQGPGEFTLHLSPSEAALIVKGLTKLTIEEASPTLNNLQHQFQDEIDGWKKASPAAPASNPAEPPKP